MFTGIVTGKGQIEDIQPITQGDGEGRIVRMRVPYDVSLLRVGDSMSCDGVCLTIENVDSERKSVLLRVGFETLRCTTLGEWTANDDVNLELALAMGDALGGHLVAGHVDAVSTVLDMQTKGETLIVSFHAPESLRSMIVSKGSVAINGVSLTVNDIFRDSFCVGLIPHTQKETTFGALQVGDRVNLEIDLIARYVAGILREQKNT